MRGITRWFYPDTGNVQKTTADIENSWRRRSGTSPEAMDQARLRLEQFVDYHESAGCSPHAVDKLVAHCAYSMPDSPRRQAFVRQAAFQPARGHLGIDENVLTINAPRLRHVGNRIQARNEGLVARAHNASTLATAELETLVKEGVVWAGPHAPVTLKAQGAYIERLLHCQDWDAAFGETLVYARHGGQILPAGQIAAKLVDMIRGSGILTTQEEETGQLLAAWGITSNVKALLLADPNACQATLAAVQVMSQELDQRLYVHDADNALEDGADPTLSKLATFVNGLQKDYPAVYRSAGPKLLQAGSNDGASAGHAIEWLTNLVRLPFQAMKGAPIDLLSDESRRVKIQQLRDDLNHAIQGHAVAKQRLLGLVDQRLRNPNTKGNLLALCGPHGNGKTTLATQGLAPALGLPSFVIDMGGMQDPRQLLGHLPVYVGAEPGKVAEALMEYEKRDIIMVFDEVEKSSHKVQDVVANLVDSTRNTQVELTYFSGIRLDLSRTIFVCTLNDQTKLSPTLRARLDEVMVQSDYDG